MRILEVWYAMVPFTLTIQGFHTMVSADPSNVYTNIATRISHNFALSTFLILFSTASKYSLVVT